MRDGYSTDCRFNRDDDTIERVRWYVVPDDAPTLPFPSVICNNRMNSDCDWDEYPVGEVLGAAFSYHKKPVPPGLGNRVCGTEDEFAYGGLYRPDLPPAAYAANGFLACCQGAKVDAGGAAAGGLALYRVLPPLAYGGGAGAGGMADYSVELIDAADGGVEVGGSAGDVFTPGSSVSGGVEVGGSAGDVFTPGSSVSGGVEVGGSAGDVFSGADPAAGGVEVGGSAGDVFAIADPTSGGVEVGGSAGDVFSGTYVDPAAGGVEVGGSAGDVYTPSDLPGDSCDTATALSDGVAWEGNVGIGTAWWFKWTCPADGTIHGTFTNSGMTPACTVFVGTCSSLDPVGALTPTCTEFAGIGGATYYFDVFINGPSPFISIVFGSGGC